MAATADALLERVGELVDRAPSLDDLRNHRIELIAARRWQSLGRRAPASLKRQELLAAAASLAAPVLMERVRDACEGPLLVMKGPEVACRYPDPALRSMRDLDVLVPDAAAIQRRLVEVGFREVDEPAIYQGIHHLRPLQWPGLPLVVEVHHSPKWIDHLQPPSVAELLDAAVPGQCGVDGMLALPPAHHAVLLAAHAWAHGPLARLRDLLDIALVSRDADLSELDRVAARWGLRGVWRTTARTIDAVLADGPRPLAMTIWARHLESARERTVLEAHLHRWLCAFWELSGARGVGAAIDALGADLVPGKDEGWAMKLGRTRTAFRSAFVSQSQHDGARERASGLPSQPPAASSKGGLWQTCDLRAPGSSGGKWTMR